MSNWCFNLLTIKGNHELLSQFVACAFGNPPRAEDGLIRGACLEKANDEVKPYLSFHATVPVPVPIQKTVRDDATVLSNGDISPNPWEIWAYGNWGCATDIYMEKLTPEVMGWNSECTELNGEFETAWTPPIYWVKKTAELFPYFTFHLFYHEYGRFFAGDVVAHGREFSHTRWSESQCEELFYGG